LNKASIIFSFILVSLFSTGSFFIHHCYLLSYKKEFKSYLQKNKNQQAFTIINITPSELYTNSKKITWEDGNKEVLYNGTLYDIVSLKTKGTFIELSVVSDIQEMNLKKQFSLLFNLNSQSKTKEPFSLLKSFLALKCLVNSSFYSFKNTESKSHLIHTPVALKLHAGYHLQETPPPVFCI